MVLVVLCLAFSSMLLRNWRDREWTSDWWCDVEIECRSFLNESSGRELYMRFVESSRFCGISSRRSLLLLLYPLLCCCLCYAASRGFGLFFRPLKNWTVCFRYSFLELHRLRCLPCVPNRHSSSASLISYVSSFSCFLLFCTAVWFDVGPVVYRRDKSCAAESLRYPSHFENWFSFFRFDVVRIDWFWTCHRPVSEIYIRHRCGQPLGDSTWGGCQALLIAAMAAKRRNVRRQKGDVGEQRRGNNCFGRRPFASFKLPFNNPLLSLLSLLFLVSITLAHLQQSPSCDIALLFEFAPSSLRSLSGTTEF